MNFKELQKRYDTRYIKKKIDDLEKANEYLSIENQNLKKENKQLVNMIKNKDIKIKEKIIETSKELLIEDTKVNKKSSPEDKIKLFKSIFKGRDDVFALRWESKNQLKSGYSPACMNEWKETICQKSYMNCSDCLNRDFIKLSDQVIYDHLSGKSTIGIYPLTSDDKCFFLAIDFDKNNWKEDITAFFTICNEYNIPLSIEKSRSGNGAHAWIFFNEPVIAFEARRLGKGLLMKTMEKYTSLGLKSFDRLFPNQDKLPIGGFGNLIALPLQKKSLLNGNSVFIDEKFIPYKDQWEYLSGIKKISLSEIKSLNSQLRTSLGKDKLLIKDELPKEIKVIYSNKIYISKSYLTPSIIKILKEMAQFYNPKFYKAKALRLSTYNIPRLIDNSEDYQDSIALPRGCLEEIIKFTSTHHIKLALKYHWNEDISIYSQFQGQLTPKQEKALETLLEYNTGILSASTGFGKTIVAISLISRIKKNTLIMVHTKQLLEQWINKLKLFLNLDEKQIGQYGGGKKKRTGFIDVALIQSLNYKHNVKEFVGEYGCVIVDECHHISAFSFEQVLKQVKAKFVYGLTATLTRKDGLQQIVKMQLGDVRYHVDAREEILFKPYRHIVKPRIIEDSLQIKNITKMHEIYQCLVEDEYRNEMIIKDILQVLSQHKKPLVLTERTNHLTLLAEKLKNKIDKVIVLRGGMGKKQLKDALDLIENSLDNKGNCVILATGKFIGEGFDDPRLDTMFLTMPISWKGTLQQYVGRLQRDHKDKKEVVIYDYVDNHDILKKMYDKRTKGYRSLGYEIRENHEKEIDLFI